MYICIYIYIEGQQCTLRTSLGSYRVPIVTVTSALLSPMSSVNGDGLLSGVPSECLMSGMTLSLSRECAQRQMLITARRTSARCSTVVTVKTSEMGVRGLGSRFKGRAKNCIRGPPEYMGALGVTFLFIIEHTHQRQQQSNKKRDPVSDMYRKL